MLSSKGAFSQQSNLVSPITHPYSLRNVPSTKKLFVKDKITPSWQTNLSPKHYNYLLTLIKNRDKKTGTP